MTFTREQRQIAYKKLPSEVQDLIMSNETTELISNTLQKVELNEEQANLADSEILHALFCLQSLDEAINNIAKLSGKSVNNLSKVRTVVENEIFSKYKIDIKEFVESNKKELSKTPPANLPMVAPTLEEVGVPTQPEAGVGKEEQKPKVPLPDYRYDGGKDPYREPLT